LVDFLTPEEVTYADIYFVMLDPFNNLYFGLNWDVTIKPLLSNYRLPVDVSLYDVPLLELLIPNDNPPVNLLGIYTFAIAAMEPNTLNPLSNIATVSFEVE